MRAIPWLLSRTGARPLAVLAALTSTSWAGAQDAVADRGGADAVAEAVRALREPGSAEWVLLVRRVLLEVHDADGSGWLDAGAEVGAVTCATWQAVDAGVRLRWDRGVWDTYGVGGGAFWLASVLGVDLGARSDLRRALVGCHLGPVGGSDEGQVAAELRERLRSPLARELLALPDGGSDAWDGQVRTRLVAAHDHDATGRLDQPGEVEAVSCEVWEAVDAGVRQGWGSSLYAVYGFAPEASWVGGVLGVAQEVRTAAAARLEGCGLAEEGLAIEPDGPDPEAHIRALRGGGTNAWDDQVRRVLLGSFDADGSGMLDEDHEVDAVPCEVWRAVDAGVRQSWPAGLYLTYGFDPDLVWIGDAIGLHEGTRQASVDALRACEVQGAQQRLGVSTDPWRVADRLASLPDAGGPVWTEIVRASLLRGYDADRSTWLDRPDEVRAVPCTLWSALDLAVRRDRGKGLVAAYGLDPDRRWRGWALGVQAPLRAIAEDAVRACLLPEPVPGAEVLPEPAPDRLAELLLPFDLDLSGSLERAREVRRVPCSVWKGLDAQSRRETGLGALDRYGLHAGARWTGDVVGITAGARAGAVRAAARCLPR